MGTTAYVGRAIDYWSADIRYIDHGLGDFKVYSVTILDNYSRAIVASGLSRTQDLGTFLMVLFAAIRQHGAPEGLVTDGGSIFRAKPLLTVLERLGVVKHEIARRQAWQNSIEANFGIQRRLADWGFAPAGTWPELLAVHDHWVTEHNFQDHSAHTNRPEDRRSPAAVLHRVCGKLFDPEELHRIFYSTRFGRVLDRAGYARFRRWRVYAERGLGGEPVAVWLYAEHLTLVYQDEPLAQYRVAYRPDQRRLQSVTPTDCLQADGVHIAAAAPAGGPPEGGEAVSIEANVAVVRRHFDLLRRYDEAVADAIWAEDIVVHEPQQTIRGRDGAKRRVQAFREAFPDGAATVHDVVAQGDRVAVRYVLEGTHRAPFAGAPATGKRVALAGIAIFRLTDGRIVEFWGCADFLGFLQQLGSLPAPGQPGGRG